MLIKIFLLFLLLIKGQTLFTVNEPWQEIYSLGKGHKEFQELEQQIIAAFQDFAILTYGDDDDEVLYPVLMRAE